MGQPVTVVHKPSSKRGVERFEINRSITGMDHERYVAGEKVDGDRPVDQIARTLLEQGGVDALSINSNVITVDVAKGGLDIEATKALIADMFTYYRPGVEVPVFVEDSEDSEDSEGDSGSED